MDVKDVICEDVGWIPVARDKIQQKVSVKLVMTLEFL